ncbi:MAG: hypothetical protein JWQ19_2990 [Subtercola sp.]|nr:hypothetical protein [Subtercola sp.]
MQGALEETNRFERLAHIRDRFLRRRDRYTAEGYWGTETLQSIVSTALRHQPGQRFTFDLEDDIVQLTLRELGKSAHRFAVALRACAGSSDEDVVAIVAPNSPGAVTAFLGTHIAGMISFPLSTREARESFEALCARVGVAHVVVSASDTTRLTWLNELCDNGSIRVVWTFDDRGDIARHRMAGMVSSAPSTPVPVTHDGVHLLTYTSGSTARPKIVLQTDAQIIFESRCLARAFDPFGTMLVAAPVGHIAGIQHLLIIPLLRNADVISMHRWNAHRAVQLAREFGAEALAGTSLYFQELQSIAPDFGGIRGGIVGGGPVAPVIVEAAYRSAGVRLMRCYGSTEHPTITQSNADDELTVRATTDGRAPAGTEIRIVDSDGSDLPTTEPGEVLTRGPDAAAGYLEAELHATAFDGDDWFHTGDIGVIDASGMLTLTDRLKDIIIRGGENISAKEIEDRLNAWSLVFDVAVVGVPDDTYGERACAFVTPAGTGVSLESMRSFLAETGLERFKWPEYVRVAESLPRSPSGKVNKQELRRSWTEAR